MFFFNTEYRFKGCFLYPYNKAACLSVCVSDASPCPHFWADFKSTYIYGLPMVQGRFKNYFQGNRSRNKKKFNVHWFFQVGQKCPSDRCPSNRSQSYRCPSDRCPSNRCLSNRCPSDRCLSDRCQSLIWKLYASLNPKGKQEAAEGGSEASVIKRH